MAIILHYSFVVIVSFVDKYRLCLTTAATAINQRQQLVRKAYIDMIKRYKKNKIK